MKRILSEQRKKIIYLGDGQGDYCPSLMLRESDFVMPRKNFPVWDLISNNPNLIKASIHGWSDGVEFEKVLLSLIQVVSNAAQYHDCKLIQSFPISSHVSQPVRVPF